MSTLYSLFFGWLPQPIQIVALGFFALLVIILVVSIVKRVLDSLPFL